MKPVDLSIISAAANDAGFGEPEWEHRFHPVRKWRFDLSWPALKVAFEREGGTWQGGRHVSGAGFRNDCEKYNAAQILGWIVVRGTVDMIQNGKAVADLMAALLARQTAALHSA
jgi:hypothetical protein